MAEARLEGKVPVVVIVVSCLGLMTIVFGAIFRSNLATTSRPKNAGALCRALASCVVTDYTVSNIFMFGGSALVIGGVGALIIAKMKSSQP